MAAVASALALPAAGQSTLTPASPDGVATAVVRNAGLEGRVIWLDGTANLQRLSTREGVASVLDHCVRARINTVVVDVKPLSGHVLYESRVAPRLKEWRGFRYPPGYDLLKVALEEGRRRGLKIYGNINVFSDGHKLVGQGPVYDKPDEQAIVYDVERTLATPRGDRRTLAIGLNRTPGLDQVTVYDSSLTTMRPVAPDESYARVLSDRVDAVAEGPSAGVAIPRDGYLLVGRGEGARWLIQKLRAGDQPTWTASERMIPIVDAPSETVAAFVNPANPVSRAYLLRVVDELAANYDLDGIVFDRMRYSSLQSDFSELSRQKFEEWLGTKIHRFPSDVFAIDPTPGHPIIEGPYYRQWLEWRARNIRTWLEEASKIVRTRRPRARVGAYVGSWYSTYYTVGVNWGSDEFTPGYDWMSPTYSSTAYAGLLDWITTGCYHPIATREQAKHAGLDDSYTVQAAAEMSTRAVGDTAFVYAGLYAQDFRGAPVAFREAIQAARDYSHGVMLFDLSQIEEYGWWPLLEEEFHDTRSAPHDVPDLLTAVRSLRKAVSGAARHTLP